MYKKHSPNRRHGSIFLSGRSGRQERGNPGSGGGGNGYGGTGVSAETWRVVKVLEEMGKW